MTTDTYSGEFYCVKCKEKRQAEARWSRPTVAGWPRAVPGLRHQPEQDPRQGLSTPITRFARP